MEEQSGGEGQQREVDVLGIRLRVTRASAATSCCTPPPVHLVPAVLVSSRLSPDAPGLMSLFSGSAAVSRVGELLLLNAASRSARSPTHVHARVDEGARSSGFHQHR